MENKKLKIIFVGIPDMALVCLSNLLNAQFNIAAVVPPKKSHETYCFFKTFVESKGLNLLEFDNSPNDIEYINKIKELDADIGVVCSYNNLLKKEFLSSTKMGYINCHPSFLPHYRGAAPYFHIINNGEKTSGITLHFMDETFDTGDIIYQEKFEITPFETMGSIFNRTTYMLADALTNVLLKIENNEQITKIPQNKQEKYIQAPKVGGIFRIRWNNNFYEIERLIRACNPFYSAFSAFRGAEIKIIKASAIEAKHNRTYGEIVQANENSFVVAAKNGFVSIEVLQVGTWGIFNTKDFYYTFSPNCGEILV